MPSGVAEKEEKAKLDAAMAIAALSNGLWDPVEQQGLEANPYSRRSAAHNKRGGHRKSLTKINNSNGSHVMAPVMPARAKNAAKRKRTVDVSNDVSESDIPKSQAAAGEHLQDGKFVRSAKQTVLSSLTGPDGGWYRSPWYRPPESPLSLQSPVCSPESIVSNTVAVTDGGVPSEAKQTNGLVMTSLSPLFLPGSGFQLVQLFPSGAFGQSGDIGLSSQLMADPHLLQLLCQQGNFVTLSIPNSPNPGPAVVEELDNVQPGDIAAKASGTASPACPAQLPGSLSTLRNYYNMTNTSEPVAGDQPAANIDVPSPSKVQIVSQPTIANSYQITNDQFLKMRLASSNVASLGGQGTGMLHMARGQHPNLSPGDDSASTLSDGATSATVGTDSSLVSMPGSLNILRSYYSSLTQKTKQSTSVRPSADHKADHIRTTDSQSSCETLESALNLSKHRQGDQSEIQGTPGIRATEEESTGMAVNLKKMLNNGQSPLSSSSYVLGSVSTASSSPLRILPKIGDSLSMNAASPASSHLSDDPKRPDSVASSISSVHLPPKKRRKVLSPEPIAMPLDDLCVVFGDEKVPLSVFMSRIDSSMHQIVFNQIQSAMINQPASTATSADVSSKLPVIASRLNLASSCSSAGLASVPNLNVNVNSTETGSFTPFSIPSSVMSPNIHLLDIGVTHGKKNAQVPAKNGNGDTDQEESQSTRTGSFQLPSLLSSSLSQLSTPSLSGQILNPVLQPDEDGDLPLHVAVAQGELRVVEQIVNMMCVLSATIDCRNYLRQTPLHVAVVTGNCDIVRCLLEAGASPNIADRNGQNCFHLAVQYKQVKCLQVLFTCSECRPDLLNYEGMTPLHLAVKLNLPDAVSMLLHSGVQRDAVDGKSGHTALYMAADTNRLRVAEILLSFGANVQIASYSGCSPVQAASSKSFHEMVKLLVKYGGTSDPVLIERSSDSKDSSEFGAHHRKGKV